MTDTRPAEQGRIGVRATVVLSPSDCPRSGQSGIVVSEDAHMVVIEFSDKRRESYGRSAVRLENHSTTRK
jgi:RNase P/RNase MRP subunit p29